METTRAATGSLQGLVDGLAEELARSVVIDDPLVRVVCTSRHFGDEDEVRVRAVLQRDPGREVSGYVLAQGVARWTGAGTVPANAELGLRSRLCVPLRAQGELLGLLLVMDADGSLTDAEIARIEEVARSAAALLQRDRPDRTEQLVADLLSDDGAVRRRAVRDCVATHRIAETAQVAVVAVDASAGAGPAVEATLRSVLEAAARMHPGHSLVAVEGGRGTLVRTAARLDPAELVTQGERIVLGAAPVLAAGAVVAGIGDAAAGPDQALRSAQQARAAARAARLLPHCGPVARWADLGAYGPLMMLPAEALHPGLVPEPVLLLLGHPKAARLVPTLRTYLDLGGSVPRTAEALHLHRTSLYYRLEQVTTITGLDLDDGGHRLLLHLGLLLAELTGPGD